MWRPQKILLTLGWVDPIIDFGGKAGTTARVFSHPG